MRLTAQQLRSRFALDYRVVTALDGPVVAVRATRAGDLPSFRVVRDRPDERTAGTAVTADCTRAAGEAAQLV